MPGLSALALLLAVLVGGPSGAAAQTVAGAGPWFDTDQGSVRLISAVEAVGEREEIKLGLEFQLKPGWKIYWRSPGDAGFPPRPDWHDAENVAAAEIAWPAPERFTIFEMETLGYKDEVVLPLSLRPNVRASRCASPALSATSPARRSASRTMPRCRSSCRPGPPPARRAHS